MPKAFIAAGFLVHVGFLLRFLVYVNAEGAMRAFRKVNGDVPSLDMDIRDSAMTLFPCEQIVEPAAVNMNAGELALAG